MLINLSIHFAIQRVYNIKYVLNIHQMKIHNEHMRPVLTHTSQTTNKQQI